LIDEAESGLLAKVLKRLHYPLAFRGISIYLRTPRLLGLLALNLSAAAASSMVIVKYRRVCAKPARHNHNPMQTEKDFGRTGLLASHSMIRSTV